MSPYDSGRLQNAVEEIRRLHQLLAHIKKRLMDEYGIEITADWEQLALKEHDLPFPRSLGALAEENRRLVAEVARLKTVLSGVSP